MGEHYENCHCGCGMSRHASDCGHGHSSCHPHHGKDDCCCSDKFLELADEAWKEVLKEKIKAKIIAKKGEHMEKLAELIAVANAQKWKHKVAAKIKTHEFKDHLKEYFSSCSEQ